MICPNCDREASFTEHEADHVETHGLDCGPYERWTEKWLECDWCGAPTDEAELDRIHAPALAERLPNQPPAESGRRRQTIELLEELAS